MKLHNYQQRMIEFCKATDNIIFSVGMGLGKTAAVLHYINETSPGSVLIVAPKNEKIIIFCKKCILYYIFLYLCLKYKL